MITIEANGKKLVAKPGEMLLAVLRRNGINVPTLCNMEDMAPSGACRMCVVEVEGQRGLVPSCAFPVSEGMKVKTNSPRAIMARKTIVELLLANHPDDCNYCVRNGTCQLQDLAHELGVRERRFTGPRNQYFIDKSSPSIVRDPAKCILCGKCVRVCEEIQCVSAIDFTNRGSKTIVGTAFNKGLNVSSCINCGQCILVCPTGALTEQTHIPKILDALADPDKVVVVQHAPAVSVSLAEEFGMKPGSDVNGIMVSALRTLGFDRVFDTSFTADLTIMEEATELVHRVTHGGKLPMFTSCSPGWIKYVETFYPDMIPHLSTCKSPQQMMGAVIKTYFAEREGLDPKKIYSVSVMPCTAKKFECGRPEMSEETSMDVDAVITTRELAQLIRMFGIDMNSLSSDTADTPFGRRSGAGKIFGATGGVMEAAIRTAHWLITGEDMEELKVSQVRGLKGIREAKVKIGDLEVGVAVASGIQNARELVEEIRKGRKDLHFIEVMTCPGGCAGGGGQPIGTDVNKVKARILSLYNIDKNELVRTSHSNKAVKRLYDEFFGEPYSEKAHHILHTTYQKREVLK